MRQRLPNLRLRKRRAWPGGGASAFPTAPDANPRTAPALWLPSEAPDVVVLETTDVKALVPPGFEPLSEASLNNELHLVVAQDTARLRLCLRPAPDKCPECLIILRDSYTAMRIAAAARFERAAHGHRLMSDRLSSPSSYKRTRLVQLLDIHDELEAGASAYSLAYGRIFPNHRPLASAIWKGSGERRHVHRLIAEARHLVGGGYRTLLHHG